MIDNKQEYNCKKAWVSYYLNEVRYTRDFTNTNDYSDFLLSSQSTISEIQKELDEYEKTNMKVKWWFKSLQFWWRG